MRRYLLLGALVLSTAPAHGQLNKLPAGSTMPGVAFSRVLSQTALYFVTNQGQVDDRVYYYVRGRDRDVFVTEAGLTLLLRPLPTVQSRDMASPVSSRGRTFAEDPAGGAAFAVRLEFVDARPHAKPQAEGTQGPLVNLFTGGQDNWRTGIPTTSGLVYKDLWPGIDLALVGDTQRINYEFRVKPGADPDQIRMLYRGGAPPRLEPSGDLAIDTPLGTIRDQRPFSYQESGGQRTEVGSRYALAASEDGSFGFALSDYDRTKLLVIDPAVFVYASYLGGAGEDRASAVAVDASGAAYITGDTTSSESTFPTGTGFGFIPGVDRTHNGGGYDAFVAKVHPSGTGLEYVTYVGGSGADQGQDIAVDGAGAVYVTGQTNSGTLFPTVRGPQTVFSGARDVFVFKLDPSGTVLLYSGFIGGADDDRESNIAIDTYGSAYVTGLTYSKESTFPTGTGFGSLPGADQTQNGDADAFVVKVSPDGSSLQFASYIGGSAFDNGYSIGIDAARNVYVGGNVGSNENTFPDGDGVGAIPGPDTTYNGGAFDAFVVKLNPEGTSFEYVAFVGGAGGSERDERYATGFAVDPQGSAWIAGGRASAEDTFPTGQGFGSIPGFDRTSNGGRDGFVVKINSAGTAFDFATYIGGSGEDDANAIAVDGDGNAYVLGDTSSNESTFPDGDGFDDIPGPDTSYNGGPNDIFVVKLNAEGTGLEYATYIGGSGSDLGTGIALDASSNAYVVGYTTSTNSFPGGSGFGGLPGFDHVHNGGGLDAFVVKIGPPSPTPTAGAGPDQSIQVGATVTLQGSGSCPSGSPLPTWSFIGKPPDSAATLSDPNAWSPTFVADAAGYYTLGLQSSCNSGTGFDYVTIRAKECGGGLTIHPVSVSLPPGSLYHFLANGGTGNYTWSIAEAGSGTPSIVTTPDGGADYRAGDDSGKDSILLADSCSTKTATVYVKSNEPPEAVDFTVL
jgi:Beta-propeller repeat